MKIDSRQLAHHLAAGRALALIDVRTPVEHAEIRISGSHSMPLDRLDPEEVKSVSGAGDGCVLICLSGKRAEEARRRLEAAGVANLIVLEGGVTAWNHAGLPVERSPRKVLPLIRQVQLVLGLLAMTGSILALTVHPNLAIIPAVLGGGLAVAGATGWCGLAMLLSKMPWNRIEGTCSGVRSCSL
ncbi:MAG: rhodanese-like domain-containing protein [Verrucomicrobiae bacterium]|nr:rhodanese-like domain-containing protein [Verrucomicrobiae bacterium]